MRYPALLSIIFLMTATRVVADFLCGGFPGKGGPGENAVAKLAVAGSTGTRRAVVLFAQFNGEQPGWGGVPGWSREIFDPQRPGSFSHFYDTMSFGALEVRGEAIPRVYESARDIGAYLAGGSADLGEFGSFVLEVLRQADRDIDFSRFDSDGADGVPGSGDDDGIVDALFVVLASTPSRFLIGNATGMGHLGFEGHFVTDDRGGAGQPIRIAATQGIIQRGRSFTETVGAMCHEYGHVLGLPDLYDTEFLSQEGARPEEDSAGIGAWGLMGWGALGWNGDDGPNSFCASGRICTCRSCWSGTGC